MKDRGCRLFTREITTTNWAGRVSSCPWQEPSALHPQGDRPCWADGADAEELHEECDTGRSTSCRDCGGPIRGATTFHRPRCDAGRTLTRAIKNGESGDCHGR